MFFFLDFWKYCCALYNLVVCWSQHSSGLWHAFQSEKSTEAWKNNTVIQSTGTQAAGLTVKGVRTMQY